MTKFLSLAAGTVLVLAFGFAHAEDSISSGVGDTNDNNMIRNDDLSHIQLDPDRATMNQMPAESEIEGSAAGGVSADTDNMGAEIDQDKTPSDKSSAESEMEGQGAGGAAKDYSDGWQKEKDVKKGESSVDKSSEGSAAGGPGEGGATKDSNRYQYRF